MKRVVLILALIAPSIAQADKACDSVPAYYANVAFQRDAGVNREKLLKTGDAKDEQLQIYNGMVNMIFDHPDMTPNDFYQLLRSRCVGK